jgi:hypothetical protein
MKIAIDDQQAETLRNLAAEPFALMTAWAADGSRRQLYFFANREGERLGLPCVAALATAGLVSLDDDPRDAEKLVAKATAEGVALLGKRKDRVHA